MTRWKDSKDEARARALVHGIETITKLQDDGQVALLSPQESDIAVSALGSLLSFHPEIPKEQQHTISHRAVFDARRTGAFSLEEILKRVTAAEKSYLALQPKRFTLLTSISIVYGDSLHATKIRDVKILFSPRAPTSFQIPEDARESAHYGPPPERYTTLRAVVEARCEFAAATKALEAVDLLRGMWNFGLTFRQYRISGSKTDPVNEIVLGPIHTLHEPSGKPATERFWWEPSYIEPIRPRGLDGKFDRARKWERWIRRKLLTSGMRELTEDFLIRYARALDDRNLANAFVRLWGLLEDLTGTRARDSYDITVQRASHPFIDAPFQKLLLNYLRSCRNDMVHQGEDSSRNEELVYELKSFVDELLRLMLVSTKHLRSFDEFIRFLELPKDDEEIRLRMRLLRLATRRKRET